MNRKACFGAAVAAMLLSGHLKPACAQATPPSSSSETTQAGPAKGANSFTEGQAQDRIAAAGFASVAGLKKDADGVWHGTAMRNGATVQVWLDYTGRVGT